MSIERLSSDQFQPRQDLKYVDVLGLHPLFEHLAFKANVILVGPKGIAKSLSISAFAADHECPVVTYDCSEDVRRTQLIGGYILRGSETPFVLGPLPTAIEVANEVGKCILCLEEANCLEPTAKVLLPSGKTAPIHRLQVGDEIVAFNEQGRQRSSKIIETSYQFAKSSVTILTRNRRITCSMDHRFWTIRGWVYAKDIKEGDEILHVRNVRLSTPGSKRLESARANGTWSESEPPAGIAQKNIHERAEQKDLPRNKETMGRSNLSCRDERFLTLATTHGQPRNPKPYGPDQKSANERVVGNGRGETYSNGGSTQAKGERTLHSIPQKTSRILELPQREKVRLGALATDVEEARTSGKDGGDAEGAFREKSRSKAPVCSGHRVQDTPDIRSSIGRPGGSARVSNPLPEWLTVHQVVRSGPTPLIEIGVEEWHTYVANGLATHNCLSPQMQKVLNPIADFRRRIEVPEAQAVFKLNPKAQLWVVGTMNTAGYAGVYDLNEDLKSRFNLIPLDYPPVSREKTILAEIMPNFDGVPEITVDSVLRLAAETRQGELAYALSTRDVVQIIQNTSWCGLSKALWIASGKFEGEDRATVKARMDSIFGIRVS